MIKRDRPMGFEDDYNPSGSVTLVNRYGLGARGIDRVERTEGSTTTYGYPLYDGHGNMRTTLARNGSGYTTGTFKTYDVWGSVRSGGDSSDPKQKYCGSLGHVSDDESGLIYMRARYHEPSTGRFFLEDPAMDGGNWYIYCGNEPVGFVDRSGKDPVSDAITALLNNIIDIAVAGALFLGGRELYDQFHAGHGYNPLRVVLKGLKGAVLASLGLVLLAAMKEGLIAAAGSGWAFMDVVAYTTYGLFLAAFIVLMDVGLDSLIDAWSPTGGGR